MQNHVPAMTTVTILTLPEPYRVIHATLDSLVFWELCSVELKVII